MSTTNDVAAERRALIDAAREWGYFSAGVAAKAPMFHGRRILDVGMGAGPHAVAYVESGAASYVGVDPHVGSDKVRDFRSWSDPSIPDYHSFPFSVKDIERLYPNVRLHSGLLEDVAHKAKEHRPNLAMLNAVTEHLRRPDLVFKAIWELLDRDGVVWADHHNYYSWTGHHQLPRNVASWRRDNPAENAVVDWKHLEPAHPSYNDPNFNRVRLEDLRLIVAKYFEIEGWRCSYEAVSRMTPEIRTKWRKYSLAELLTQTVVIVGRRRDVPLDIDFKDRQFHHPDESYQSDRDYLNEDMTPFDLDNRVFFSNTGEVGSHSTNNFAGLRVFDRLKAGDTIVVTKLRERYTFTVAEVVRREGASASLRLAEPVPEPLRTVNYSDWTIEV
ncbi:MAG: class I SAM-dependent methyltransferase [Reyranella sp.]|nr:class I SAM-dependent methyltransferase [Reyranella sp.]